ncbi:MAG: peptidylprolyl isomerase [Acidobacteria bacterium]|nr:peptidylprolyl isomerase [Acidobacteriota bacterium]
MIVRPANRSSARWLSLLAVTIAAAGLSLPLLSQDSEKGPKLYVYLEASGRYMYTGDPTEVSILFKNVGDDPWTNPGMDIAAGFEVTDSDGKKLEKTKAPALASETQPKVLQPNAYFGQIIKLDELFPKINRIGSYRITWSAPDVPAQSIIARVIKKYDPKVDYKATIETEFGDIVLDFYKELAPLHVRNFIDLVNLGFYDDKTMFHRIIEDQVIFGGSPTGDERGCGYNTLPPEPNGLKILKGSIAQVRNSLTGLNESACIFLIAAEPQPQFDSRYTVFARVVEGLETVKSITNLPRAGGGAGAAGRPIKDVTIKKIRIDEKKKASGRKS